MIGGLTCASGSAYHLGCTDDVVVLEGLIIDLDVVDGSPTWDICL